MLTLTASSSPSTIATFSLEPWPRETAWRLLNLEDGTNAEARHESEVVSPNLDLPEPVDDMEYASRTVIPRADTGDARKRCSMRVMAKVVHEFQAVFRQFGKEWAPESFPFAS